MRNAWQGMVVSILRNLLFLAFLLCLGFLLPRLIPGSPLFLGADELHASNVGIPEEAFNRFKEYYAPDAPLATQLKTYASHLARGDWGYSFYYGLPVKEVVASRLGWTLFLSLGSLVVSVIIAIPLGVRMALTRSRFWHRYVLALQVVLQTVPVFLLAILFQLFFSYQLGWFPASGAYEAGLGPGDSHFWNSVALHAALPFIVMLVATVPQIAVLVRNVVQKVKKEPYVESAYYNGLSEKRIRREYILRNSLPEMIGKLNIQFLYAIAGALFIEIIFSLPGMGSALKIAIDSRDYPLVQGVFLVVSIYCIGVNMLFEMIADRAGLRAGS